MEASKGEEPTGLSADEREFVTFLTRAHNAFLKRDPDEAAISSYLERKKAGLPDRAVVTELALSEEYNERLRIEADPEASAKFFRTIFRAFLCRDADDEAVSTFIKRRAAGLSDRAVVMEIALGEEYTTRLEDRFDETAFRRFFENLFHAFFGRAPDEEAIIANFERFREGLTDRQLVEEFAQSSEYEEIRRHRLFVQPGHYYSAVTNTDEVAAHLNGLAAAPLPESLPGLRIDCTAMISVWDEILPYMQSMPFPEEKSEEFRYFTNNPNFVYGDGAVWHGLLRHLRPARVVEIGSGFSSANLADTTERFLGGAIDLTFVEPFPDLLYSLLGPAAKDMRIYTESVQTVDRSVFTQLQAGDVLFIDSTHVLRTGSDVQHELFDVLPMLAEGVIVHIHDIFWPFEYPRRWALEENRSWNELYGVRAFLTDNPNWEFLMFGDYLAKVVRDHVEATLPKFLTNPGGSLYLRKTRR